MATPLRAESASFQQAVEAAKHGDWDTVVTLAQAATTEDPKNAAIWSLLADAQMNTGDTSAAVADYQKSLDLDPKYAGAVISLTRYYVSTMQLDQADAVVSAAEAKDRKGKSDEIKVARGMVLAAQGNFAEARTIIASAAEKNRKNALYPWILARIYEDQKVHDLAEENYAKAWALDPGDPTLAFEYGLVLQEQKKYNEALGLFKVVQEKDPANKTVDYLIGRLYFAAGQYAEAVKQFEKAVEKRPDHFLSNLLLGRSWMEISKAQKVNLYPRAVPYLRKAVQLRPDRRDARSYLAEALLNQSRAMLAMASSDTVKGSLEQAYYDSTIVYARQALEYDSALAYAHDQIARAYDKKGMLDSAAFHEEIEIQVHPGDRTELTRLVSIYQREKNQAALVHLLEPLMSDSLERERFGLILVNAYSETNDFSNAKELVQRIIAADPSYCAAHQTYAYIVLKRERYSEAIPVLRNAVDHCPKEADMWVQLGDSYYFSNPKSKSAVTSARDAYDRACQLGSGDGCKKKEQVETILHRPGLQ